MAELKLRGARKSYGNVEIIKGIDLEPARMAGRSGPYFLFLMRRRWRCLASL